MPADNLTRVEAQERAAQVQTESYEIALDLTTGAETFRADTTIRFRATEGTSTFLDAITTAVHSIELNGESIATSAAGKRHDRNNKKEE